MKLLGFFSCTALCQKAHSFSLQFHSKSRCGTKTVMNSDISDVKGLEVKSFLKTILSSRSKLEEKEDVIKQLQAKRSTPQARESIKNADNEWINFMESCLSEIKSVENNKWANFRYPIPLPSYRVKLGTMRRMLKLSLQDEDISNLAPTEQAIRQRRALSMLFNQLKSFQSGGVRGLEKEALRRTKNQGTMEEMLQRTPEGLETPVYKVIQKNRNWEVRSYDSFSVCSMTMDETSSGASGFNSLAGYIFGKNKEDVKMAMTTPVISNMAAAVSTSSSSTSSSTVEENGKGRSVMGSKSKKMSFVMPSKYWGNNDILKTAPTPIDDSKVQLEVQGGGLLENGVEIAVVWFGGISSKKEIDRRVAELKEAINNDPVWCIKPSSSSSSSSSSSNMEVENAEVFVMIYNDPFQPPWKRRNEVAVKVVKRDSLTKQAPSV